MVEKWSLPRDCLTGLFVVGRVSPTSSNVAEIEQQLYTSCAYCSIWFVTFGSINLLLGFALLTCKILRLCCVQNASRHLEVSQLVQPKIFGLCQDFARVSVVLCSADSFSCGVFIFSSKSDLSPEKRGQQMQMNQEKLQSHGPETHIQSITTHQFSRLLTARKFGAGFTEPISTCSRVVFDETTIQRLNQMITTERKPNGHHGQILFRDRQDSGSSHE